MGRENLIKGTIHIFMMLWNSQGNRIRRKCCLEGGLARPGHTNFVFRENSWLRLWQIWVPSGIFFFFSVAECAETERFPGTNITHFWTCKKKENIENNQKTTVYECVYVRKERTVVPFLLLIWACYQSATTEASFKAILTRNNNQCFVYYIISSLLDPVVADSQGRIITWQ